MDFRDFLKLGLMFSFGSLVGLVCGWLLTRGLSLLLNWSIPAVLSLMGH